MASSNAFPVFIRAEYDGSSTAFREFENASMRSTDKARRLFVDAGRSIETSLSKALSSPRNELGSLCANHAVTGTTRRLFR